jgi:hypothetical protein
VYKAGAGKEELKRAWINTLRFLGAVRKSLVAHLQMRSRKVLRRACEYLFGSENLTSAA